MLVNNIQYSYLKNGAWNTFSGTSETAMDGIKIQTPKSSPYFLRYRTWNSGKSDWYSRVDSNADDYAGAPNRPRYKDCKFRSTAQTVQKSPKKLS